MQFTMEHMLPEEHIYAYHQTHTMNLVTGAIGCFHGYLTYQDGIHFNRYWDSFNPALQTPDFESEFAQLIQALKTEKKMGQLLSGSKAMGNYCHNRTAARIESRYKAVYGFRVETPHYMYLLRIDARSEHEDFFIYAYRRLLLDQHIAMASIGIEFKGCFEQTPRFTIVDGDNICIQYPNGSHELKCCRFLSFENVDLNGQAVPVKEFISRMDKNGCKVFPVRKSLPVCCYFCNAEGLLMEARPGNHAFLSSCNSDDVEQNKRSEERYNKSFVTPAQFKAMVHGATHSWADPEADPANYDENGNLTF